MITIEIIKELRNQRLTYQKIADKLGVSRQRIHQVFKNYKSTPKYIRINILKRDKFRCHTCWSGKDLEVHHINGVKKDNRWENLLTFCRFHHQELEKSARRDGLKIVEKSMFNPAPREERNCSRNGCPVKFVVYLSSKKSFCSKVCSDLFRTMYTPEQKKQRLREYARKFYHSHKAEILERKNRPETKKAIKEYLKHYYQRPEVRKRMNEQSKRRYHANIDKGRKYLRDRYWKDIEKSRQYNRVRYQKRKLDKNSKNTLSPTSPCANEQTDI